MTVNKELQLESCPCYDCSTIEGEPEFSTSRNIGVIQWYLGYCKFILYQHTYLLLYKRHHLKHGFKDMQTDAEMHNNIHAVAPTSLYNHAIPYQDLGLDR